MSPVDLVAARRTLRASEVARLLGVSKSQVNAWAADGQIGHYQITPKLRLFALEDVERFLAERGHYTPATQTQAAAPKSIDPSRRLQLLSADDEPWRGSLFGDSRTGGSSAAARRPGQAQPNDARNGNAKSRRA